MSRMAFFIALPLFFVPFTALGQAADDPAEEGLNRLANDADWLIVTLTPSPMPQVATVSRRADRPLRGAMQSAPTTYAISIVVSDAAHVPPDCGTQVTNFDLNVDRTPIWHGERKPLTYEDQSKRACYMIATTTGVDKRFVALRSEIDQLKQEVAELRTQLANQRAAEK